MNPEQSVALTQQLANEVTVVFGADAVIAVNDRVYATAAYLKDADFGEWLRVFTDAFVAELRRVLRPH